MKKMIVCSLLTLMCAFAFTACGTTNNAAASTTTVSTEAAAVQEQKTPAAAESNTAEQTSSSTVAAAQTSNAATLTAQPAQQNTTATVHTTAKQEQKQQTQSQVQQNTTTVEAASYMRYVCVEELQVRQLPSTNAASLGALKLNAQVQVTGNVLVNGYYTNWVRVNFNGKDAYMCSDYLSADAAVTAPSRTGESFLAHNGLGCSVTVFKYTDGTWRDDNNEVYEQVANMTWENKTSGEYFNRVEPTEEAQKEQGIEDPTQHLDEAVCFTARVKSGYLAIRNEPATDAANETGALMDGEAFYVTDMLPNGFWFGYTANGVYGFVNSAYLF